GDQNHPGEVSARARRHLRRRESLPQGSAGDAAGRDRRDPEGGDRETHRGERAAGGEPGAGLPAPWGEGEGGAVRRGEGDRDRGAEEPQGGGHGRDPRLPHRELPDEGRALRDRQLPGPDRRGAGDGEQGGRGPAPAEPPTGGEDGAATGDERAEAPQAGDAGRGV
ncbi:MAG: hypothetical protein AVDCRST_MAG18-1592, partial [uncultured Thermomicrobiales bacterium]